MGGRDVGHRAASLPWLCPAAGGLLALTDDPPDPVLVRHDPALVIHVLRYARPAVQDWSPAEVSDPAVLRFAAEHLAFSDAGRTDWQGVIDPRILSVGRRAAAVAARLHPADPDRAFVAALLAPLGWYAIAAIEPGAASTDQTYTWGLSADAIARRLLRAWNVPGWLVAVVGNLNLPAETAESLGADPDLFRAVQAAVAAAERATYDLRLAPSTDRDLTERASLFLRDVDLPMPLPARAGLAWETDPRTVPLIVPLLKAKAEPRRQAKAAPLDRAETENDTLRALLSESDDRFIRAVEDAKLTALAELAAGAGHEINNPLAVISGHCQRLLSHEEDEETRATLETVVRQTKRIHDILRGLMQFARPSKPNPQPVRVADLIGTALGEVRSLAAVKAVELRDDSATAGFALGDAHHLRTGLVNLLRNAIEAAGPDGWVRVTTDSNDDRAQVVVEDSGPGPSPRHAAHLFDPFYSGKSAGRGRGLGLSVAWRLAQINGATLRHDPTPHSPARFVLSLPAAVGGSVRVSA